MKATPYPFKRYRDLDRDSINIDLQMHTTQTDGQASIDALLDKAIEVGLNAVAFTEHVRRSTDWFPGFVKAVADAAASRPEIDAYVGCEAKALDSEGGFDASEVIIEASEIVLGSVHRFPDGKGGVLGFDEVPAGRMAEWECELSIGMLRYAPIHVLAHPGGMHQRHHGAFPSELFRRMMEASLERGIAVEINASYLVDVDAFLALCDEINPYVSIGSDVHHLDEMGRCRNMLKERFGW